MVKEIKLAILGITLAITVYTGGNLVGSNLAAQTQQTPSIDPHFYVAVESGGVDSKFHIAVSDPSIDPNFFVGK